MDEQNVRLIELNRRWDREVPPIPPAIETEAAIGTRLAAVGEARQAVFDMVERQRDDTIELLREMVRIPSVNPSEAFEQEMAAYSARLMRELGMDVQEIETAPRRGNALGKLRTGDGPSLLFYAHID